MDETRLRSSPSRRVSTTSDHSDEPTPDLRSVAEPTPKPFAGPGRCTIPKDVGESIEALRLYPTAIGANVAAEIDQHNVYGPLYRKWLKGPGHDFFPGVREWGDRASSRLLVRRFWAL